MKIFRKKSSLAAKLLVTAVLTVPFMYEKKEEGGFKLRAVLYDLDVTQSEEGKDYKFVLGGLVRDQAKTVKALLSDFVESRKRKNEEENIDADFAEFEFTEEEEAELNAEFAQ